MKYQRFWKGLVVGLVISISFWIVVIKCVTAANEGVTTAIGFGTNYLVAYWTYDDNSTADYGGYTETGSSNTFTGSCIIDGCAYFDGTDDYIEYSSSFMPSRPWTYVWWGKADDTTNDGYFWSDSNGASAYSFGRLNANNFDGGVEDGGSFQGWSGTSLVRSVIQQNWIMYSMGIDSSKYMSNSVDGSRIYDTTYIAEGDPTTKIVIGNRDDNARDLKGNIDEFMIFNKSLSESETMELYAEQVLGIRPYDTLSTPTNLATPSVTGTSIYVTWTNPTESYFDHVEVYYNYSGHAELTFVSNESGTSKNVTGLNGDTTYSIHLYSVATNDESTSIGAYINDATTGNSPPTTPTSIKCNSSTCNQTFNNNVIINCSGSTDADTDTITYLLYKGNETLDAAAFCDGSADACSTWPNSTACGWDGGCSWSTGDTVLGESGSQKITDSLVWVWINFDNNYDSSPVVLATPNTTVNCAGTCTGNSIGNGGYYPIPLVKDVNETGFNFSMCVDGGNQACSTGMSTETFHWFAFDVDAANKFSWIDVGTKTGVATNGANTAQTLNGSMSAIPDVWTQAQTYSQNGNIGPVAWVDDMTTTGFNYVGCVHGAPGSGTSENTCDSGQPSETFGYVAIVTSNANFSSEFQSGKFDISNSDWTDIDSQYDDTQYTSPMFMVTQNDDDGAQDPEYAWIKDTTTSTPDIRYCEQDAGDECNTHTGEWTAWFAFEEGDITAGSGEAAGCSGTADPCGTYNASQTSCDRVSCDWNLATYSYNYSYIGNHTDGENYTWPIVSEPEGEVYERMRCRAIDLDGSNTYSSNYTIPTNLTIGVVGGSTSFSISYPSSGCNEGDGCTTGSCTACTYCSINFTSPDRRLKNCTGQEDATSFYVFTNTGDVNIDITWAFNQTIDSSLTLEFDTDNNPVGSTQITTSDTTIVSALASSGTEDIWMWGNVTDGLAGSHNYEVDSTSSAS